MHNAAYAWVFWEQTRVSYTFATFRDAGISPSRVFPGMRKAPATPGRYGVGQSDCHSLCHQMQYIRGRFHAGPDLTECSHASLRPGCVLAERIGG
jgi:hypothetical protein